MLTEERIKENKSKFVDELRLNIKNIRNKLSVELENYFSDLLDEVDTIKYKDNLSRGDIEEISDIIDNVNNFWKGENSLTIHNSNKILVTSFKKNDLDLS